MTNPHLARPVVQWGRPLSSARVATIAVHGRDRDPEDILGVCRRIGRADFAHVAPAAAEGSWYPLGFMMNVTENEPWISHTLERIDRLVGELAAGGFTHDRIVLLGFSQGACSVAEYALRNPRRYGALLVFTGGGLGPPGTRWNAPGDFAGTPVLVSGSEEDAWVPASRMRETAAALRTKGATVTELYYAGRDHVVNDDEIAAARKLLETV